MLTYVMKNKDNDGNPITIKLEESEYEKDLGIQIDNKLNVKNHVHRTTARANRIFIRGNICTTV